MQLRRGNQSKKNTNIPEYEIKTYENNVDRNRSPKNSNTNSHFNKQRSIGRDYQKDLSFGEMEYVEPSGENPFSKGQKKFEQKRNYNIRSPLKYNGNKENSNLNTNKRIDMTSKLNNSNYNQIPNISPIYDNRREKLNRSPKTINIGETAQEAENNIKKLGRGRSPKVLQEKENLVKGEMKHHNP